MLMDAILVQVYEVSNFKGGNSGQVYEISNFKGGNSGSGVQDHKL
jgi:hypothetical protein